MSQVIRSATRASEKRRLGDAYAQETVTVEANDIAPVLDTESTQRDQIIPEPISNVEAAESHSKSFSDQSQENDFASEAQSQAEAQAAFEAELDALREAAKEDGYREGLKAAESAFSEKLGDVDALLAALQERLEPALEGIHDIAVDVCFESMLKVFGIALLNDEAVTRVVSEVVRKAKNATYLRLHVNERDMKTLKEYESQLRAMSQGAQIEIVADGRVVLGGCMVETDGNHLDGRLEQQLQKFKDALLQSKKS